MTLKLLFLTLLITVSSTSQEVLLSPEAKISILTVGPGESLNDAFGHNAFRIRDSKRGIDVVYGYGRYDFDAPNFYLKFAQGKLNYLMSENNFSNFYASYSYYNRTIKEQILNLSPLEKQKLFNYLINNYKPENRKYLYDFFYDNCATRIRDVTKIAINDYIKFSKPKDYEAKTFRQLIHDHVGLNTWGSLGIDLALGSVIDRKATVYEQMFLPKYIHSHFRAAKHGESKNLVKSESILFQNKKEENTSDFLFSPLVIMGIVSVIVLYITYKDHKDKKRSKWLDIMLFAITGLVGIVLLLLWFATDHTATAQNYNLLWAVPLNIVFIHQLFKKEVKSWFKSYLKFLIIMFCLLSLHWMIGVQVFAIGLIPLLFALLTRYIYILRHFNRT